MEIRIAVESLDALNEYESQIRTAYIEQPDGSFRLHDGAAACVAECRAEMAALVRQHVEAEAARDASIERKDVYIRQERITTEVERSLVRCGAAKRTLRGALAVILLEHDFLVGDDGAVTVDTAYGVVLST